MTNDAIVMKGAAAPAVAPARPSDFSAAWLFTQEFEPLTYVIPGILPEGLSLLVAAPKIGKSWMSLQIAWAVATGDAVFGCIPVDGPRPVLYLALEDSDRRLQSRMKALGYTYGPEALEFCVDLSGRDVFDRVDGFLQQHVGERPLVIIDTLGKVMRAAEGRQTQYEAEYGFFGKLKGLGDAVPGSSIIGVHHTRKAGGDDFVDAVSGTNGIAGSADTVLLLRRERVQAGAVLSVTSREVHEADYKMVFDNGAWTLDGESLEDAARAMETAKQAVNLGDNASEVLAVVNRHPQGVRTRDIVTLLPHLEAGHVRMLVSRLHESNRIAQLKRGCYAPVASVSTVAFQPSDSEPIATLATVATAGCDNTEAAS